MNSGNILALDTEVTTHNKGSPYDSRNKLVCWSRATSEGCAAELWNPFTSRSRIILQNWVDKYDILVGFNFKFDYHWISKSGVDIRNKQIWDVQIVEYVLSNQTNKFPSLNETCLKYGIPVKKDVVNEEYWSKGIQTDEIPWPILEEYVAHDAYITLQCYHAQQKVMSPKQKRLCQLMCADMHVLREMEAHGIVFDEELCDKRAQEVEEQILEITTKLKSIYPHVPINFGSVDCLSAFLYGGKVIEPSKEHIGFFKTGEKKGQPKYKNIEIEHILPRLYEPLKGSMLKKEGLFKTDESTLKKLKGKKDIVNSLLSLAKLVKLNGTYYKGLTQLREEMYWEKNMLHGQFNQCAVGTGRLSSSRPNLQNFASELQDIFVSRFND